jgi:aminocarboxymuconate-semialdehyde decarboxylase
MSLVIDAFAHVMPRSFADTLVKEYPTDELKQLAAISYFGDMENTVRMLDKHKIDKQVLTLARPTIWINMPPDLLKRMTSLGNDSVAEAARTHPDRFIPVGTLPVPTEEYLPEFDRCINDLGMAGIQILSNVEGRLLDDPAFRPFFAKANVTRTPVWIHPQLQADWSEEFGLDKIFGWPFDTTMAMARVVFSGMMEEFPDLKIIVHHMGAMVPYFSERIKGVYDARAMFPKAHFAELPKDPLEYFKRFYADCVLNGAVHAFECGYKFFGPEQVLFATDYPFGPKRGEVWITSALSELQAVDLPQREKEMIYSGNLLKLIERR